MFGADRKRIKRTIFIIFSVKFLIIILEKFLLFDFAKTEKKQKKYKVILKIFSLLNAIYFLQRYVCILLSADNRAKRNERIF